MQLKGLARQRYGRFMTAW